MASKQTCNPAQNSSQDAKSPPGLKKNEILKN